MNFPFSCIIRFVHVLGQVELDKFLDCRASCVDNVGLAVLLEEDGHNNNCLTSFIPAGRTSEKLRRCPICHKKMEKVYFGDDQSVIVDRCGKEHGIWFDRGELNSIIELATGGESPVIGLLSDMFGKTVIE